MNNQERIDKLDAISHSLNEAGGRLIVAATYDDNLRTAMELVIEAGSSIDDLINDMLIGDSDSEDDDG